ncbi:MAG: anti-sigma factor family protein [Planctomycetota bacterium]
MKVHEDFETTADLYVAGALAPEERRAVEAHVAECGPCAETLGQARAFSQWLLGTLSPDAPPADLEDRILERLEAAQRPKRKIPIGPILKTLGSLAAAGLLITLGFLFTGVERSTQEPGPIVGGIPEGIPFPTDEPLSDSAATPPPLVVGADKSWDSNPQGVSHTPLKRTCLPIPPSRRNFF